MAFGIGGSKASSSSTSVSDAQSTDFSSSLGTSKETVAFEDLYKNLFGQAFGASANVAANLPTLRGEAATLFSGGMDFLGGLQGAPEQKYLESRLTGDDSVLQEQIGGLSSDLGKLFREELLPSITGASVAGNTLGGSRQGVAQGKAAEAIAQQFTRGATSLRASDQAQRDAAATGLGALRTGAADVGLNALPNILGLAEAGATSDFLPLSLLKNILGGPMALSESFQSSLGYGQSTSTSASSSKAKSGSFSFGL